MARDHDELPLPDFDHILVGHLPARIAGLEAEDVQALLDYEKAHARRLPIQLVLQRRIEALKKGAKPAEGGGGGAEGGGSVGGGSKVSGTSRKAGGASRSTLKVNPGGR